MTDLVFSRQALAANDDRDVLFGYQILLGRDPESSFVIAEARRNATRNFLLGMMDSAEFQAGIVDALRAGRAVPHEAFSLGPTDAQRDWLMDQLDLEEDEARLLREAQGWRGFLGAFLELAGTEDTASAAAPSPETAAQAAEFVLIHLDSPRPGTPLPLAGTFSGNGWVIAPSDIAEVRVLLDGALLTHARYGLPRPDVAKRYPHYRHVDSCGWAFSARVPPELAGARLLEIAVTATGGEAGRKSLVLAAQAASPGAAADPAFPAIRLTIEGAEATDGRVRARGWVVAQSPLVAVELYLGREPLGRAEIGLPRPDVAREQPRYPNAATAGWNFVGPLPDQADAGPVALRVEAVAQGGEKRQATAPLALRAGARPGAVARAAAPAGDGEAVRLEIDRPALAGDAAELPVRGALTVSGWVVAQSGIEAVEVLADGEPLGRAYLGMRREDIGAAFPDYADSLRAGYALVLPAGRLTPGTRRLAVRARGRAGGLAERAFTVEVSEAALDADRLLARVPAAETALGERLLAALGGRPRIAVAIATDAGPDAAARLERSLDALEAQAYPEWSVTLAGPRMAPGPAARRLGTRIGRTLPAEADLVLPLRAGDVLGADALLEFAIETGLDRDATLLYADELRRDPGTGRVAAWRKPGWSAEYARAGDGIGRPWITTAARWRAAGLDMEGLATRGLYDALLRVIEQPGGIRHVPRLLAARGPEDDPERDAAALAAALERRGTDALVVPLATPGLFRVKRRLAQQPRVSLVMPTCGGKRLVEKAVTSIRDVTRYRNFEFVVLDNVPRGELRMKTWLRARCEIVLDVPDAFNWSRFNNLGARRATGEVLVFLNDDVEAREADWLDALLEYATQPEVGVTGPKLLYPDGKVQHAGQFLAAGHARHAFRFAEADDPGPFGLASVAREVASVTGACMAVRRDTFARLQGFDEAHSVVNNDLDFCLRAREAGLAVMYTPHARLIHHELASREKIEDVYDEAHFLSRWRRTFLRGDPFQNPRLLPDADQFASESEPPRVVVVGPPGPPKSAIAKILAVKLDHLGDFITALPALRALRERFPGAALHALVPGGSVALAEAEPAIDRVYVFDFFHTRSGEGRRALADAAYAALAAELAGERYDLAIDLRMQPETREVLRHTGAALTAGYDHDNRYPWLDVALEWEGDQELAQKRAHVSERLLQLVATVDAACRPAIPTPLDPARPRTTVPALAGLAPDFLARPLVVVHPGVGNVVRQWPARHYAGLIDLLVAELGVSVALIGAAEEAAIAAEVLEGVDAKTAVVSLVGRVKLAELPDLFRAAALFVGNNSGPQHIAAAAGVPAIGIHSGVVDAREWAPLGPGAVAIRREMVCGPCYLEFANDCPRGLACLTGLRPSEVFALCRRMLAVRPPPAPAPGSRPRRPARAASAAKARAPSPSASRA